MSFDLRFFVGLHWRKGRTNVIAEKEKGLPTAYLNWFRKPVVLLVIIRKCHVPIPCSIIGESDERVRIRVNRGYEVDLLKKSILAVEEDALSVCNWVN